MLVVGATGGLGSRIADKLAQRGARLTLVGRMQSRLDVLDVSGARVALDLRLPANIDHAVAAAVAAHGGLDVVVNAAGVVAFGAVADLSTDTVEELFMLNAFMPMALATAALRELGDDGVIANISAIVADHPQPGMAAYSASKAALTAFDTSLRREVRRTGLRVLDIRPPHTATDLSKHPIAGEAPRLPAGKEPDEVAERIVEAIADGTTDLPSDAF